jgi:putative transposase
MARNSVISQDLTPRFLLAKPLALYQAESGNDPHTGMALAYLTGDYAMKAIADAFDVHYTTVSRAVRAYEAKHGQK